MWRPDRGGGEGPSRGNRGPLRVRTALIIDPRKELAAATTAQLDRFGIFVVAVVGYGLEALESVYQHQPDLVLISVDEPAARPLQLIERLRDALPDCPIIGVVAEPGSTLAASSMAAGAFACVAPGRHAEGLVPAITSACAFAERRQRDFSAIAEAPGHIITVLGAKGGVGKTTVATNLAVALAFQCPDSVALIDADPAFGDVALALDLHDGRTLANLASRLGELEVRNARDFMTARLGLWVLASRPTFDAGAGVSAEQFSRVLDLIRRGFDFIVIDTSGAMTELNEVAAEMASTRILVTTPENDSLSDARRTIRLLRTGAGNGSEAQLLLNRAGLRGARPTEDVAREVGLAARWVVSDDSRLRAAMQEGVPAVIRYSGRGPSKTFRLMAEAFAGVAPRGSGGGGPSRRPRAAHRIWSFQR